MVRKATPDDLPRILTIYALARQTMRQSGNTVQWRPCDAPEDKLADDIAAGQLYVVAEGETLHGVFAYIVGDDPTYDRIDGTWLDSGAYGTLHRMGSDGAGGGVFAQGIRWAKAQRPHLRADTHESNTLMRRLLESAGFQYTGVIYEPDGSPRRAYEWLAAKD